MTKQLEELLLGYNLNALQTISRLNDLQIEAPSRQAFAEQLATSLAGERRVASALEQLDSLERLALEHLLLQEGPTKTDIVKQELLQSGFFAESPSVHYTGSPYRQMPRYFEDVIARLTALGLVFSERRADYEPYSDGLLDLSPGPRIVLPEQIRRHLGDRPSWVALLSDESIAPFTRDTAEVFQRDLFLFWSYIHRNEVNLTSHQWIPKRHWSRINDSFWGKENLRRARTEGETGRLYFMRLLMEDMGLLEQQNSELRTSPGSRAFLGLSLRARTERSLRAWLRSASWNELERIPELHLQPSGSRPSRMAQIIRNGRQFIVGLLRHAVAEAWISIDDLTREAKKVNPEFLLSRHGTYGYHAPYHSHNTALSLELPLADEGRGWEFLEARFIVNILTEPLHWLGVVELGWQGDRLAAIRVPTIGAQILGIVPPEPEQLPQKRVIVQPNFQIFALDPVSDHTLSVLDDFAERVKSERVFEYKLTRDSVYEAQQRGMGVSEIIRFLDGESSAPVPQNVKLTLQEWGRYHERIVFYQGVSLCQVADPALLEDLLSDKKVASLLGRRVSSSAALVHDDSTEHQSLRRALQDKGLLPTSTKATGAAASDMEVRSDGTIRFRHRVPDFHLVDKLSPFTAQKDGQVRITEESVSQAAAGEWTAIGIIDLLTSLQGHALDARIARRIKIWGKHYGDAAIEKVSLLQVKNAHILQELSQDPEIGPLIRPFSPVSAVAIVRDDDVPRLQRALRERNMELSERLTVR